MNRAEQALASSALRILRRFQSEGIPFTGPVGSNLICWNLNAEDNLATAWSTLRLEDGLQMLSKLESQLKVFEQCEDHTRQGLSEWADAAQQWQQTSSIAVGNLAHLAGACEAGMDLITQQIGELTDPLGLDEDEDEDDAERATTIEEIAKAVDEKISKNKSKHRLESLSEVLYSDFKFKYEPFEWVYEGMKPLMLEEALKRRKGAPAALALAATAVGRTSGIPLLPLPAAPIESGAGQDPNSAFIDPQNLENLSPDLQLRISSSTQAAAPGPGPWILKFFPGDDSKEEELYLDAATGEVLSSVKVKESYPLVGNVTSDQWQRECVLKTWQGLCRIAMQGFQRRGESDFVAHWMYITLALDPGAPEWRRALVAPEVGL